MPWYLMIRQNNSKPEGTTVERHLRWLRNQHERGVVLISGPDPELTRSIYVVRAPSSAAAEKVARADPLDHDGQAPLDIIEWHVHQLLGIGPFEIGEFPTAPANSGDSER
jgi:uncharacterized protein YciI